jgi:hypothetical protein
MNNKRKKKSMGRQWTGSVKRENKGSRDLKVIYNKISNQHLPSKWEEDTKTEEPQSQDQ